MEQDAGIAKAVPELFKDVQHFDKGKMTKALTDERNTLPTLDDIKKEKEEEEEEKKNASAKTKK